MATLDVQKTIITGTGLEPSYGGCGAGGDDFVNSGKTFIHIKNGSGGALNITVDSPSKCSQGFEHDVVISVPAGKERMIGPFAKERFNDSAGKVQITYTGGVVSLTIAAIEVP